MERLAVISRNTLLCRQGSKSPETGSDLFSDCQLASGKGRKRTHASQILVAGLSCPISSSSAVQESPRGKLLL